MPQIDGELIPLYQFEADATFSVFEPMASGYDGAGRAVADAVRGQLYRTLMEECPADHLDVSWDTARRSFRSIVVFASVELIRAGDPEHHEQTAGEIKTAINKTAETLDVTAVHSVEVQVSELTASEPEQLIPDPTEDDQDQDQEVSQ